jgi:TPR repeat protein
MVCMLVTRVLVITAISLAASPALLAFGQASDPAVIADIKSQASRDNPDAMFALAIIYEVGRDLPQNRAESLKLLVRAAASGHPGAKSHLGRLYQTGTGVPRDDSRATALYREAAAAGDAEGQYRLGMALAYGIGTPKDPVESRRWLAGAANQRHPEAQLALGLMLQQGVGGEKNEFAARRWLRAAAAADDPEVTQRAKPIVEQLDAHLLYSGISGEQLLTGALILVFAGALAAEATDSHTAFRDDPSNPLNPRGYDSFGATRRQRNCQFRSVRGGIAVTSGRDAFPVYSGPSYACF